jgi:regulator of sirC expression with transglutaminase-like and TPR domain
MALRIVLIHTMLLVTVGVMHDPVEAASASLQRPDLLHDLVAVETSCGRICSPSDVPDTPSGGGALDQHGGIQLRELERTIQRWTDEARTLLAGREGSARVEAINRLLFERIGLRPSEDLGDPANLLVSQVVRRRRGYCVGIASVYLVLSRRLNLPIRAVATPSHVFLRYDDGQTRVNIETFQKGATFSDEHYVREQRISDRLIRRGIFMRSLTDEEFLAQVHNNLGVIFSRRRLFDRAAAEYRLARRLLPRFPTAWYNEANDLLTRGDERPAVRAFSEALRLYPEDPWALNNRGLAWQRLGRTRKARRDFEAALRVEPGFAAARANLEALQRGRDGGD